MLEGLLKNVTFKTNGNLKTIPRFAEVAIFAMAGCYYPVSGRKLGMFTPLNS